MIEYYLRKLTTVFKNQFDFMSERSTMEVIFLIRQLMERYQKQKDLYMIFINLEKYMIKYQEISCGGRLKINEYQENMYLVRQDNRQIVRSGSSRLLELGYLGILGTISTM
jgi:hypothetical protein